MHNDVVIFSLRGPVVALGICICVAPGWLALGHWFTTGKYAKRMPGVFRDAREQGASPDPENDFETPAPNPTAYTPNDLATPQPYRPFRHGPNFITMGIRKVDWDNLIEMDANFLRYHDTKAKELEKDFHAHVQFLDTPTVRDACFEVFEELTKFLTRRYPKIFKLEGGVLHNFATGEAFPYPASK